MASLNATVQQVADNIDEPFNNLLKARLEDMIITSRALLYRREFASLRQFPSSGIYEHVMEVHEEDNCVSCTGGMVTDKFPELINVKDDIGFTYVGVLGRQDALSYILPEEIGIFKYNKISGKMPRYTIIGRKIHTFNTGIEKVLLRGPFVDPRKLKATNCEEEGSCFDADNDDFIESHLAYTIRQMCYAEMGMAIEEQEVEVNGEQPKIMPRRRNARV